MATNPRRAGVKKAGTARTATKRVVPRQKPVEPEIIEPEELEEDGALEEGTDEEVENVNEEEVPESIRQVVQEAMDATRDDDLESMPVLTIEMIQEAQDRVTEWIPVKEWGGKMQIKSLSAASMFAMMSDENAGITESGFKMDLSVESMQKAILQNGIVNPVITDAGFKVLMEKTTAPVMRVLSAIMKISKLGSGEKDGNQPLDEEVKTFRPTGE